jgi:hypothetical protein
MEFKEIKGQERGRRGGRVDLVDAVAAVDAVDAVDTVEPGRPRLAAGNLCCVHSRSTRSTPSTLPPRLIRPLDVSRALPEG